MRMEKDDSDTAVGSCGSSTYTLEDKIKHPLSLDSTISIKSFETWQCTSSNSPSLILLFSWTGAQQRHISKYVKGYEKLFPTSPVLVIGTSIKDLIVRSSAEKQRNLQSTIDVVINSGLSHSNVLVHCFSDGGSNKAVEFAEAYHTRTGEKLPCQTLCLDSTPGHPRYFNYTAAFQKSLPQNIIVRCFGLLLGMITLAIFWFSYYVLIGFENNVITKTRRRLEDERYWSPKTTPRLYLFSEADDMIYWKDIERHGVEAAKNGVQTALVRFRNSGHCNHVKEDESKYWSAVREVWEMRDLEIGVAL
ncbi:hypothetical protein N431DRAFT_391260 [Stipitochalara longipes BDJ]|nr:hypothetical protein N431DRAFT_391260 [Stipitochalara longipes BDJ]